MKRIWSTVVPLALLFALVAVPRDPVAAAPRVVVSVVGNGSTWVDAIPPVRDLRIE